MSFYEEREEPTWLFSPVQYFNRPNSLESPWLLASKKGASSTLVSRFRPKTVHFSPVVVFFYCFLLRTNATSVLGMTYASGRRRDRSRQFTNKATWSPLFPSNQALLSPLLLYVAEAEGNPPLTSISLLTRYMVDVHYCGPTSDACSKQAAWHELLAIVMPTHTTIP